MFKVFKPRHSDFRHLYTGLSHYVSECKEGLLCSYQFQLKGSGGSQRTKRLALCMSHEGSQKDGYNHDKIHQLDIKLSIHRTNVSLPMVPLILKDWVLGVPKTGKTYHPKWLFQSPESSLNFLVIPFYNILLMNHINIHARFHFPLPSSLSNV